ncbi:MAG: hypothetical protein K6B64_03620, partial [Acholeplasmatales bacterium]|nr:hypothetical protein [Acholeplasmatales bacterium]
MISYRSTPFGNGDVESLKTIYDEERVELQTSNSYKKNEQKRLKTKQKINFFGEFDPGSGL